VDKEARRRQSEADKAFHAQNREYNKSIAHGVFVHGLFYLLGIARPPHKIKDNQKRHNPPNVKR